MNTTIQHSSRHKTTDPSARGVCPALPWTRFVACRRRFTRSPFTCAAAVLTVGLVLVALLPMQLVTSDAALWSRFHSIQWGLFGTSVHASSFETACRLLGTAAGSLWFVAIGYLGGRAAHEWGRRNEEAMLSATLNGLALVAVTACLSVIANPASLNVEALVANALAVILGGWGSASGFLSPDSPDTTLAR